VFTIHCIEMPWGRPPTAANAGRVAVNGGWYGFLYLDRPDMP
jgi:hypothetical protein